MLIKCFNAFYSTFQGIWGRLHWAGYNYFFLLVSTMICYQTNIELICLSDILLHNLCQAWLHITVSRTFPLLGQILNICYELQGIEHTGIQCESGSIQAARYRIRKMDYSSCDSKEKIEFLAQCSNLHQQNFYVPITLFINEALIDSNIYFRFTQSRPHLWTVRWEHKKFGWCRLLHCTKNLIFSSLSLEK